MNHEQIKQRILVVSNMEVKAKKLQAQMDKLQNDWKEAMASISHTKEWKNRCHEAGVATHYSFSDVLA